MNSIKNIKSNSVCTNILIVGVGGQGTILTSRILGEMLLNCGCDIKISEIHGMSQRGGSVATQVRFGEKVYSPIIRPGTADILLAFEPLEALRYAKWLKADGIAIVNDRRVIPMPVVIGAAKYPDNIAETLSRIAGETVFFDALAYACEAGNAKSVNVVLLGVLSRYLGIEEAVWVDAIKKVVAAAYLEANLKAFAMGRAYK